jgi:hypothetical protein
MGAYVLAQSRVKRRRWLNRDEDEIQCIDCGKQTTVARARQLVESTSPPQRHLEGPITVVRETADGYVIQIDGRKVRVTSSSAVYRYLIHRGLDLLMAHVVAEQARSTGEIQLIVDTTGKAIIEQGSESSRRV